MPDQKPKGEGKRIAREKATIDAMVHIYCDYHHHTEDGLCTECSALLDYANQRLDSCPFQESKPACNHCQVHCYSPGMRERVKEVMKFSGPRMPLRYPWLSLLHVFDKLRRVPTLSGLKKKKSG
jgi:hypothetical protein